MAPKSVETYTTVLKKYPSHRRYPIQGCWKYMEGRREDDNAEDLWRVGDNLYDLTKFVDKHPGGASWITLTKGTDITEAFETHHLNKDKVNSVLQKFFVREAAEPRNYLITFEENGFYKTLKKRVIEKLKTIDSKSNNIRSKLLLDLNLFAMFLSVILAVRAETTFGMVLWSLVSAPFIAWTAMFAHNFLHQKDNFQMYTANLVLMSWRDYRVFHVMSHHMYPNTDTDLELTGPEKYIKWIPTALKTRFSILSSYIATPFVYALVFHYSSFTRICGAFLAKRKCYYWDEALGLLLPAAMVMFNRSPLSFERLLAILLHWTVLIALGSFTYHVFAFNNGHHGPEIVHEGDEFVSLDFGVFQINAIHDRREFQNNLFLTLAFFGDHVLHHLFPTLDHAVLPYLKDTLEETCKEFEVVIKTSSFLSAINSQFQQLARTTTIKAE